MRDLPVIETFPTRDAWAEACAARIMETLVQAVDADGAAFFAGSGGSTPSPIYRRMAGVGGVDWSRITTTLIDERYVPETSPDSNARLLKETLLTGDAAAAPFIPLYSPQVTVDRAGLIASHALSAVGRPLDAVLLGMGEDGHICSMFPENPALKQLLAPDNPPRVLAVGKSRSTSAPPQDRLSMNIPWLRGARRNILAITGETKRRVFEEKALGDPTDTPIAALLHSGAELEVLWTEAA